MTKTHGLFAAALIFLLCQDSARASTGYIDSSQCDYHSSGYWTGLRVLSTINHDSGVGYGTLTINDDPSACSSYNNTISQQMSVQVRNTVTWDLLFSGSSTDYYWEGETSACEVTIVVNITGERYEPGVFFNFNFNLTPVSCDP